jgi:hypothetical protein
METTIFSVKSPHTVYSDGRWALPSGYSRPLCKATLSVRLFTTTCCLSNLHGSPPRIATRK